jgi:hypothetical protein
MEKLIRQIRSFGSQREVLVSMLPRWQKPEGTFMAPTYRIGGFNSSCTRQGGINNIIKKLAAVISALLEGSFLPHRENKLYGPVITGFLIDLSWNFLPEPRVFSTPKVLSES